MTRFHGLCCAWTVGLLVLLQGCADPIVGAECREGFTVCGGGCALLESDFRHCGACGNHCGPFVCDDGVCSTTEVRPDAGLDDGEVPFRDGGPSSDASLDGSRDGSGISIQVPDAHVTADSGVSGCGLGQLMCGSGCVNPANDTAHCGGCDLPCGPGEFCVSGVCQPDCDPPLVACRGLCIEVDSDPFNCGSCGHVCESGICVAGQCADAVPGHLVVIGHDYQASTSVMRRIATNAVFLASGAPVRVLSYVGSASGSSVTNIRAALDANDEGRTWQEIQGVESTITLQLGDADVFLVYPQRSANNDALDQLGDQWGNALGQFLLAGGVVVVFETHGGSNDGTYRILQPAKLFLAEARAAVSDQTLTVVEPGQGLAYNLTANYQSASRTSRFESVGSPGAVVVEDDTGAAVVFHRIVR